MIPQPRRLPATAPTASFKALGATRDDPQGHLSLHSLDHPSLHSSSTSSLNCIALHQS